MRGIGHGSEFYLLPLLLFHLWRAVYCCCPLIHSLEMVQTHCLFPTRNQATYVNQKTQQGRRKSKALGVENRVPCYREGTHTSSRNRMFTCAVALCFQGKCILWFIVSPVAATAVLSVASGSLLSSSDSLPVPWPKVAAVATNCLVLFTNCLVLFTFDIIYV